MGNFLIGPHNVVLGYEPCHEIMALFVFRNFILQTRMRNHLVRLDVWFFCRTLRLLPYFMCANSEGSGETARMRKLAWAFVGRICDKYHNLMSWHILAFCIICSRLIWIFAGRTYHIIILLYLCPFRTSEWTAKMSRSTTKPTKYMCAQRRLRSAWASAQFDRSSLCTLWLAKDPMILHADSEDSDQTGQVPRLIWVFAGRTCHFCHPQAQK